MMKERLHKRSILYKIIMYTLFHFYMKLERFLYKIIMYTLFHSCIPHRRPYLEYANNIVGCFTVNNGAQKILVLGERGVLCATCEFMVHGTSHVSREGKVDNGGRSVSKRLRDERTCEACSGAHGGPLRRRRRREVEFFGVMFFFFFFWEFFNEVKIYIYIYILF